MAGLDPELEQVISTFLIESRELLEQMENGLLQVESSGQRDGDDSDTLNAIFRAAHTIKGSAGIFSFDNIVAFTHVVESVLDRVRSNSLPLDTPLIGLLLACSDHMSALVEQVATARHDYDETLQSNGQRLIDQLSHFLAPAATGEVLPPAASTEAESGSTASSDNWHISLRFNSDLLQSGMDPLSFLRYLRSIGKIVGIASVHDGVPGLDELDAEACYLGFEINFACAAGLSAIEDTFEFIRNEASIRILPPHSPLAAYAQLLAERPEDSTQLGAVLVRCGSLSADELAELLPSAPPAGSADEQAPASQLTPVKRNDAARQKTVRVDADKLDRLINLVGELVIAGAGANIVAAELRVQRMSEATSTLNRLIEEVRDGTLNLRMVQIGETFNRFQRVVRDVAHDLGKDIRLEISGADTELDKTVVEKIGDPLMHLVRNAMDHGIENSATRQARGKPASGTIRLNAYHDAGSVVIEVSDDGGGLDSSRILQKAQEKGLVTAQQTLSEQDIFKLIFAPGFSTAEQITNLSGRGVGMDVVKKNIDALRGDIEIVSQPGIGSTMRIRLPLTLAIIDGFLVGVGDAAFVIPLDQVVECIDLSASDRQATEQRQYVNLRGQVLPYTRLRDTFAMDDDGQVALGESIVVVKYGNQRAGLVVDRLLGEIQTVIKPLARIFSGVAGLSGSTILGNGQVALILDIPRLVQHTIDCRNESTHHRFLKEESHD